jgi:hypothetical protein
VTVSRSNSFKKPGLFARRNTAASLGNDALLALVFLDRKAGGLSLAQLATLP